MGLKEWIGNTHDPNNVRPRIFILLIVIVLTFGFLIMLSQDYSVVAMLGGILLISLDKIFGKSKLVNLTSTLSPKTKIQKIFFPLYKRVKCILYYGIIENYFCLIGTGITIAAIISGIHRTFFGSATTIFAILWDRIADAISTDCSLFAVLPTIVGGLIAGAIGIFTVIFTNHYKERRDKKHTYKVLKLEIDANQNRLQTHIKNSEEVLKNLEENDADFDIIDLSFDRTIYSATSDKIGLLDHKIGENVVRYYTKIKLVEEEVRACNRDYSHYLLFYCDQENSGQKRKKGIIKVKELRRLALKRSVDNAKEANDIGEELIKSLKEQIGD